LHFQHIVYIFIKSKFYHPKNNAMKKLIALVLLSTTMMLAQAQNYFSNDISFTGQGIVLTTLAVNTDGSFYASGYSKDPVTLYNTPLIIKFDINGELIWQKSFGVLSGGNIQDIKVNHDGACVAVYKETNGFGTIKISPAGEIVWSKAYTDAASTFSGDPYTKFSISVANNNQLFVNTNEGFLGKVALFRITDDDGPGDGDHDGNSDEDGDGDDSDYGGDIDTVVIIEDSGSLGKMPSMAMTICGDDTSVIVIGKDNDDVYAFRVGLSGATLWSKVYDDHFGTYTRMKSITGTKDGNYMMAGLFSTVYASTYDKGILTKMDKEGTIQWAKTYTVTDPDMTLDFEKVLQTENGNFYIIGSIVKASTYTHLPVVIQVDATGEVINSMFISDRDINSVRFPTACIDGASHHNNLIFVSNYLAAGATDVSTYVNKTDDINNLSCNKVSMPVTTTIYPMEALPTRPVSGINVSTITMDVVAGISTATNLDVSSTSNCKKGTFTEVAEPNSIQTINTIEMNVYPNPTTSSLTFELNNAKNATVKIYDLKGNMVCSKDLSSMNTVQVSNLSSGLYNYIVTTNEGSTKGKFVKE